MEHFRLWVCISNETFFCCRGQWAACCSGVSRECLETSRRLWDTMREVLSIGETQCQCTIMPSFYSRSESHFLHSRSSASKLTPSSTFSSLTPTISMSSFTMSTHLLFRLVQTSCLAAPTYSVLSPKHLACNVPLISLSSSPLFHARHYSETLDTWNSAPFFIFALISCP